RSDPYWSSNLSKGISEMAMSGLVPLLEFNQSTDKGWDPQCRARQHHQPSRKCQRKINHGKDTITECIVFHERTQLRPYSQAIRPLQLSQLRQKIARRCPVRLRLFVMSLNWPNRRNHAKNMSTVTE